MDRIQGYLERFSLAAVYFEPARDGLERLLAYVDRRRYGRVATGAGASMEPSSRGSPTDSIKKIPAVIGALVIFFVFASYIFGPSHGQGEVDRQSSVSHTSHATHAAAVAMLKHRRGVQCVSSASDAVSATSDGYSTCWKPHEMAARTAEARRCYFTLPMPISASHSDICAQTMQLCSAPLRLEAAAGHAVYSVCADADPMAAPIISKVSHSGTATHTAPIASRTHIAEWPSGMPSPPLLQLHSSPPPAPAKATTKFVTISKDGCTFERNGKAFHFVGTTMWYGAHLATSGPAGDRARLERELDDLARLGVRHVRVLAASEGSSETPFHVVPAIQPNPSEYARDMMEGLDYFLKELAERDMVAVLILNNGLPWSGGMAQYVAWATDTRTPFSLRDTDWDAYHKYVSHFFKLEQAKVAANTYARTLLGRRNSFTGTMYRDDPTIMAWEIANAPRGGSAVGPEYQLWVRRVGALLKSLAPNHLVALGSEGTGGMAPFKTDFDVPEVDFSIVHVWPEKYRWYNAAEPSSLNTAIGRAKDFVSGHVRWSEQMGKPLVVEAFAMSRDHASLDPAGSTTHRDALFTALLGQADEQMRAGQGLGGISFWGWSGEGRAAPYTGGRLGDHWWQDGDPFTGDPPSEEQGKFSVYSSDTSTCNVIKHFASRINSLGAGG